MDGGAHEGVTILGRLRAAGGKGVVRIEDRLDADLETVWSALTDPTRLARWLGEVQGDLRPRGTFSARFFASGWQGTGSVEACEPPHRLLVLTTDDEDASVHALEAVLAADGGGTHLVLEERGMPVEQLPAYGAGVQIHAEDLADHVAGRDRRDPGPRFDPLFAAYRTVTVSEDR